MGVEARDDLRAALSRRLRIDSIPLVTSGLEIVCLDIKSAIKGEDIIKAIELGEEYGFSLWFDPNDKAVGPLRFQEKV